MLHPDVLARCGTLPRKPAPVVLIGERVELVPLEIDRDAGPLHAATCGAAYQLGDRRVEAYDPEALVWRWMKGGPFPDATALRAYLIGYLAEPDMLTLTVRDRATATPVGVAAFMTNRPLDLKIELGSIWYGPIAQGTGASREATQLMLAHAFGLGYRRVEWKCDAKNERSRRAALSYGFTFEGVQESHMIVKGRSRDTAWYRMLDHEWRARTM